MECDQSCDHHVTEADPVLNLPAADFCRSFPGGTLDDSTYSDIETALDRAEAPYTDAAGKWLTLPERVAALAAGKPETAPGWAAVPLEPTPEAVAAWWRVKNGHHYHDEPPPTDTSDYAAYRALVRAAAGSESNGL